MSITSTQRSLSDDSRLTLLRQLRGIHRSADRDSILETFLPLPAHELALRPEVLVVRGERGAGKSALFHFVQELGKDRLGELQRLFPGARMPESRWVEGFSEAGSHPLTHALDEFFAKASDAEVRAFWYAHMVGRLAEESGDGLPGDLPSCIEAWRTHRHDASHWARLAATQFAALAQWLDSFHATLPTAGPTWFVTYDYLDVLSKPDRAARDRAISALLSLWTSFANRYRMLRAKIFLREDLFNAATRSFPDASKLHGRSASLDWPIEALYRVLIRVMAAQGAELSAWIQEGSNRVTLASDSLLGLLPPDLNEKGRPSIKGFVDHLAGERVGTGTRKAYTYRWIPARLQDGRQRIVPRSIMNLVAEAATRALEGKPKAKHKRLLASQELVDALAATSRLRVEELREEFPEVDHLACVQGLQLPIQRNVFERRLKTALESRASGRSTAEELMEDLLRMGVVTERLDHRIDVPDLYRYHFNLKRKGGAGRSG